LWLYDPGSADNGNCQISGDSASYNTATIPAGGLTAMSLEGAITLGTPSSVALQCSYTGSSGVTAYSIQMVAFPVTSITTQ
jgi:hypothetical protein